MRIAEEDGEPDEDFPRMSFQLWSTVARVLIAIDSTGPDWQDIQVQFRSICRSGGQPVSKSVSDYNWHHTCPYADIVLLQYNRTRSSSQRFSGEYLASWSRRSLPASSRRPSTPEHSSLRLQRLCLGQAQDSMEARSGRQSCSPARLARHQATAPRCSSVSVSPARRTNRVTSRQLSKRTLLFIPGKCFDVSQSFIAVRAGCTWPKCWTPLSRSGS